MRAEHYLEAIIKWLLLAWSLIYIIKMLHLHAFYAFGIHGVRLEWVWLETGGGDPSIWASGSTKARPSVVLAAVVTSTASESTWYLSGLSFEGQLTAITPRQMILLPSSPYRLT